MAVIRLMCDRPRAASGLPDHRPWSIESVCIDRDGLAVRSLAEALATKARSGTGVTPRGHGLLAELRSRAGRHIEAWLAVQPAPVGSRVTGLVSLAVIPAEAGPRFSISWLLVHPEARRRGLGRSLVSHACQRAWELAAKRVWVEVRSDWSGAVAFWRATGFQEPGAAPSGGLAAATESRQRNADSGMQ